MKEPPLPLMRWITLLATTASKHPDVPLKRIREICAKAVEERKQLCTSQPRSPSSASRGLRQQP